MTTTGGGRPRADDCVDILDLLPVGVAELDVAGTVIRVNRALAELLDFPQELAPGRMLQDFGWRLVGVDHDAVLAGLLAEPERPVSEGDLLELRHADGRRLSVRARVRRAEGAVAPESRCGLVVVMSDVTAEQELHRRFAAQQERYRLLTEHVGDVVLVLRERRVEWASPSARAVLGLQPEELVGRSLEHLAHPDDVRELPDPVPGGPAARYRLRLRCATDRYGWFSASITGRWEGGELVEVFASLRDIDEQVAAEQAAAHTERRLRLAFDASPDGFAVFEAVRDGGGEVTGFTLTSVNVAGLADVGRPDEPVIGRDVREVVPGVVESGVYDEMLVALAGSGPVRSRHTLDTGGGPRVYDRVLTLLDPDVLLSTWRDVSDAVEGESLLERAYEETAEMRVTLQTALDATSDGFAVYALEWDADGVLTGLRVVHTNAAGAECLGLDPDEMVDMELHEFLPDVETMGLWDRIVDAAVTKAPQQYRVHVFDDGGGWQSSWDYSVSPVGEERMAITWRDVSAEEHALRQLARHRDEAMHSATHDALTGLPNRILLLDHLKDALRACQCEERVGLVFVDLDRFKAINDTYGHAAGDAVLCATAERLNRLVRHGDLAARLAGDEFVLVLTQLTADWTPDVFFARAAALLSEPVQAEGVELHPAASLGAVLADPRAGRVDVDTLIKQADAAMYQAKAARRAAS